MEPITIRTDFDVDLVSSNGDDDAVLRSMLVSTLRDDRVENMDDAGKLGRLNFLMSGRHGTPFEHNQMVFRVCAPIFVYREWHRHRIGVSINEQSGRYTEFEPVFYVPGPERPIVQEGKQGAYIYVPGTYEQHEWLYDDMCRQAESQWESYKARIDRGIALEVARMSLGVNIYSTMYWTCNARSLMSFLSLRTRRDAYWQEWNAPDSWQGVGIEKAYSKNESGAMFPSKPMYEIDACAQMMEQLFSTLFPMTAELFNKHGRVAP